MMDKVFSHTVDNEIPSNYNVNLLDFIHQRYILPRKKILSDIAKGPTNGDLRLAFTVLDSNGKRKLGVQVITGKPVKLIMTVLDDSVTEEEIDKIRQDLVIVIDLFEEQIRKNTLFFAWREGEEIVPERAYGQENKPLNRLFLETQILLLIVFTTGSFFVFLVFGSSALIPFLVVQLILTMFSGKLIARAADWQITEKNPSIHFLEYHRSPEEVELIRQKLGKSKLSELKREIYEQTISKGGEIDCQTAHKIFSKYGFQCRPEDLTTKKVNVFQLVKATADKFGFKAPKVAVSNTLIPNASSSGPSPGWGVIVITSGLLVQLKDAEIVNVLGHEFGHLKGHDPLLLFGLNVLQYLFLFYVLYPFIFSSIILFFLSFWIIGILMFFIAKFFEARADLISAMVLKQPKILAAALEKIGFKRLLYERMSSYRFQEWISLEAHPPMYFRVNRLEKIKDPSNIKHPLARSISDVVRGFIASI